MREKELRARGTCSNCKQKIGQSGLPLFWTCTLTRWGLDLQAIKRQDGMTAMMGGHAMLAQIMGPDEEMAKKVMGPVTLTICETCITEEGLYKLMVMLENTCNDEEDDDE